MNSVRAALASGLDWEGPRIVEGNSFRLACRLASPATEGEIDDAWGDRRLLAELRELWTTASGAELFVDVDYGQWGLRLFSPAESAAKSEEQQRERPADIHSGDIVIGQFLGDQELVVLNDNGAVLIALPLDGRRDWYRPAPGLADFLDRYVAADGAKFWEDSATSTATL